MRSLKIPTAHDMQEVAMLRRHLKAMEVQQATCQQLIHSLTFLLQLRTHTSLPAVIPGTTHVEQLSRQVEALHQQAEAERTQRMVQLQGLAQVALELQARLAVHDVLRITTERACDLIGVHQAVTGLRINDSWAQTMQHVVLSDKYAAWRDDRATPDGSDIYALVCQQNRPIRLTQAALEVHPAWRGFGKAAGKHPPLRGLLVVPLVRRDGRNLGLLQVSDKYEGEFTAEDEAIVVQLAQLAAAAIENTHLDEQVQAGRTRLQALSHHLLRVQEVERREIASELHDEIGQALTGLQILVGMSRGDRLSESAPAYLQKAHELLQELTTQVRELSLRLRPTMLDDLGLLPTLLWYTERYTLQTQIQVALTHKGLEGHRFALEVETAVYRIVQEALTNVARHTRVREVRVTITVDAEMLRLRIADCGPGITPAVLAARGVSTGLESMRERAELLQGLYMIDSSPAQGTRILVEIPVGSSTLTRRASS
jgi:signal transduction histidine kinase